jgi:vacuolar-type H+-ATPase subunit I/STV1
MDINMENMSGSGTKRNRRLFSVEESSSEDEKSINSLDDKISTPRRSTSKTQARKDKAAKRDNQRSITYKSALKSNNIISSLKNKSKTTNNTSNSTNSKFSSTPTEDKKRPFQPINNNYKS